MNIDIEYKNMNKNVRPLSGISNKGRRYGEFYFHVPETPECAGTLQGDIETIIEGRNFRGSTGRVCVNDLFTVFFNRGRTSDPQTSVAQLTAHHHGAGRPWATRCMQCQCHGMHAVPAPHATNSAEPTCGPLGPPALSLGGRLLGGSVSSGVVVVAAAAAAAAAAVAHLVVASVASVGVVVTRLVGSERRRNVHAQCRERVERAELGTCRRVVGRLLGGGGRGLLEYIVDALDLPVHVEVGRPLVLRPRSPDAS